MTIDLILKFVALFFVGAFSGFINVMAGGGSLITLPVLMGFGLPTLIANGTNRISILFQDIAATIKFIRSHRLHMRIALILGIPTVIGAVTGALFASHLNPMIMNVIILVLLIGMMFYVLFKPIRTDSPQTQAPCPRVNIWIFLLFLVVGFYAGFIQVGATLIWFVLLTSIFKMDVVSSNAVKIFLNFIMTPVALFIFILHHQVEFVDGLAVGLGSFVGAWLSAKMSMKISARFIKIMMMIIFVAAAVYVLFFKILHIF